MNYVEDLRVMYMIWRWDREDIGFMFSATSLGHPGCLQKPSLCSETLSLFPLRMTSVDNFYLMSTWLRQFWLGDWLLFLCISNFRLLFGRASFFRLSSSVYIYLTSFIFFPLPPDLYPSLFISLFLSLPSVCFYLSISLFSLPFSTLFLTTSSLILLSWQALFFAISLSWSGRIQSKSKYVKLREHSLISWVFA